MKTFELLNKPIQEAIWDLGWDNFRPIQDESITIIVNSDNDLIISAPTASGKTEAAFFPLISRHYDDLLNSMCLLYVSPLKALINDQFNRIFTLCKKANIKVTKWHGDANYSEKKKLLNNPKGILLITPESIEALLLRKEIKARKLFSNLKCVVIDEIHSFINNERGIHLYSLLNRIKQTTDNNSIRKVSLSATIGDLNSVKNWMSDHPENVLSIIDNDDEKDVFGDIFVLKSDKQNLFPFRKKIFQLTKTGKTLVFSNSKNTLENACDQLKQYSKKNKTPDIYRIHHGSLSKEVREDTEKELKEENNICVFCTNTLELGVNIKNVNRVLLLTPPWTVSSFIQRIGRSGREKEDPVKFAYVFEPGKINENSSYYEQLQIPVVKSIAIVELFLEKYCEPCQFDLQDYSCLIHELFAYIYQKGGCTATELNNVIIQGSFNNIVNEDDLIFLLQYLNDQNYIEQFDNGDILLADKGEKIVEDFHFYAVFHSPENWVVICNGSRIGEFPFILFYKVDDQILLAGKRWNICSIDKKSKRIIVKPGRKKKDVIFESNSGYVSKKIHEKMKEIYETKYIPLYVDDNGSETLSEAYKFYDIIKMNKNVLLLFQGSKIANTLKCLLLFNDIKWQDFEVGMIIESHNKTEIMSILRKKTLSKDYYMELINKLPRVEKMLRKYDFILPEVYLDRMYLQNHFNISGLRSFLDCSDQGPVGLNHLA